MLIRFTCLFSLLAATIFALPTGDSGIIAQLPEHNFDLVEGYLEQTKKFLNTALE